MEAVTLTYDDAIEKIEQEWMGHLVDVSLWRNGDLEASFAGRLVGTHAHDEADPPSAAIDLDTGTVVIDRDTFEGAEWEEIPTALRSITRCMRLIVDGRAIELQDP